MKYLFSILALCVLSGCISRPNTSGISLEQTQNTYNEQLSVHNQALAEKLAIVDVKTKQTNELTDVFVTLASQYNKSQYLQYQFNWFDENGFIIQGNHSPWQAITLFGYAKMHLSALAPNSHAVRFSLAVREIPTDAQKFND